MTEHLAATPLLTIGEPPRDPFYRYRWQGRDLPSWSTLRATAGIKPQVHAWALDGMADKAIELASTLGRAAVIGDAAALGWARERLWDAAVESQGRRADLGTRVHLATHDGTHSDEPDVAPFVAQYAHWKYATSADIVASEFEVYDLTVGYGGTADRLVLLPDGGLWLVDLKTGRNLWGEHALQLTAYAMAEFVGRDDTIDERLTALLHRLTGVAVLHLRPDGWSWHAIRADGETWAAFRGLHRFATWQHAHDDLAELTVATVTGRSA